LRAGLEYSAKIGRWGNTETEARYFYGGLIDEVALFNRALTQNEIAATYASGNAGMCDILPPSFASDPSGTNVPPGGSVTFCVSARGSQPILYQWRKNGIILPGATNSCVTVANVQPADGGDYSVSVQNSSGAFVSAAARLRVDVPAVPPGDNFANRVPISGFNGTVSGTNQFATRENEEPNHAGKVGGKSVWYVWTPPASGIATFNTRGSSFDTLLGVYKGTTVENLSTVASDDDSGGALSSALSFNAVAGAQYAVAIDGAGGAEGDFVLHWELEVTAEQIPVIVNPPLSQTVPPGGSHTFSVTPQNSGLAYNFQWFFNGLLIPGATNQTLTVTNASDASVGDYLVQVSSGGRVIESQVASLQINVTGGETQPVQAFHKVTDALTSPNQLVLGNPGNGFARGGGKAATLARGYSGTQIFSTDQAGIGQADELICNVISRSPVYIRFTVQETGTLYLNTDGSSFDTVLGISDPVSFASLACDDNNGTNGRSSAVTLAVQKDQAGLIRVGGAGGTVGVLHLNYSLISRGSIQPLGFVGQNNYRLRVNGYTNMLFSVQTSSNLQDWVPLTTILSPTNIFDVIDRGTSNAPVRFYRALMLPKFGP
ncbi:MAG: hypothetical protein JWM16_3789, partial [Verrucomicrobiales bacterium]|nr:hypothetical protein [Verrucomicrobiales bacterium]